MTVTVTVSTVTATASTRARRREDASAPRPFPRNQSWLSRATEPTHARARAPTRRPRRRRVSLRSRPFVHAPAPSSSDARRHVGIIIRNALGTTRAPLHHTVGRPSPTARRVSRDGTLWYASRRRDDPSRRCRSRSRDASERQFASDGNAWMEINGRVGIVARGAKLTHKCVSTNTRHHGDRHSPCGGFHQAFTPAENQPSPSEQGT